MNKLRIRVFELRADINNPKLDRRKCDIFGQETWKAGMRFRVWPDPDDPHAPVFRVFFGKYAHLYSHEVEEAWWHAFTARLQEVNDTEAFLLSAKEELYCPWEILRVLLDHDQISRDQIVAATKVLEREIEEEEERKTA